MFSPATVSEGTRRFYRTLCCWTSWVRLGRIYSSQKEGNNPSGFVVLVANQACHAFFVKIRVWLEIFSSFWYLRIIKNFSALAKCGLCQLRLNPLSWWAVNNFQTFAEKIYDGVLSLFLFSLCCTPLYCKFLWVFLGCLLMDFNQESFSPPYCSLS